MNELTGRCAYDPKTHTYWIGRYVVPGITEILKAAGVLRVAHMPASVRNRGQAIHKLTERHDMGFVDICQDEGPYRGWCLAYCEYLTQHRPAFEAVERAVYHRTLGFATQIDRWGQTALGKFVLNIKTGPPLQAYEIQSAGEALALCGRAPADMRRETLYIKKTRRFVLERHNNLADYHDFLNALERWGSTCHDKNRHAPLPAYSGLSRRSRLRYV